MNRAAWAGAVRRGGRHLLGLAALLMASACATDVFHSVDPKLFPKEAVADGAAAPMPARGRVAVLVPAAVGAQKHTTFGKTTSSNPTVWYPTGQIVEAALVGALGAAFQGGAQLVSTVPAASDGFSATLVVTSDLQVDYDSRFLYWIPAPPPLLALAAGNGMTLGLSFDVRLLDTRGETIWTHRVNAGPQTWQAHWPFSPKPEGFEHKLHEAAWRDAEQVAREVKEWAAAERMKPRAL